MARPLIARLEPLFEVVTTDILMWEATRRPRRPRTAVELRVDEVGAAPATDPRSVLPEARWDEVLPFLERRDTGYVAQIGGRFAGWIWMSRRTHKDPWSGLHIGLAADEAYAYALWVEPEFRPHGVARSLMTTMLETIADDPRLARVYGWVDKRNRESQMLLRLLGFVDVQVVKRVRVLRRFGWQLPRTDAPAFGPVSAAGRHRPR